MDIVRKYLDFYENLKNTQNFGDEEAFEMAASLAMEEIDLEEAPQRYSDDKSLLLSELFERALSRDQKASAGVFYTDEQLAKYMAGKAIDTFLESCADVPERIMNIRILDPSCGCGAFPVACLERLLELHAGLNPDFDREKSCRHILENNLFAVDVDGRALSICRRRLSIITGIEDIELNLFNQDFISEFCEDGFDIVIGNPPYIGEKGNKEIFDRAKRSEFGRRYYEKGMDYFYYFIEKAAEIVKCEGLVCFITTNYWTGADYSKKLRQKLKDSLKFRMVVDFNDFKVFSQATGQHNMIFILQKRDDDLSFGYDKLEFSKGGLTKAIRAIDEGDNANVSRMVCSTGGIFDKSGRILFMDGDTRRITEGILERSDCLLGDVARINQGIVSGADRVTRANMKRFEKNGTSEGISEKEGIFVLKESELKGLGINPSECQKHDIIKPFYKSSNVRRYETDCLQLRLKRDEGERLYILYVDRSTDLGSYPALLAHLERFKPVLQRRREAQTGVIPWYSLHWPRKREVFEGEKIVSPQRARIPVFAYNNCQWHASADVYYITRFQANPFYILGILNSRLSMYWLYNRGKRKGEYLELYQRPLSKIPISMDSGAMSEIADGTRRIMEFKSLAHGKDAQVLMEYERLAAQIQREMDDMIYEAYGIKNGDVEIIEKLCNRLFPAKLDYFA